MPKENRAALRAWIAHQLAEGVLVEPTPEEVANEGNAGAIIRAATLPCYPRIQDGIYFWLPDPRSSGDAALIYSEFDTLLKAAEAEAQGG